MEISKNNKEFKIDTENMLSKEKDNCEESNESKDKIFNKKIEPINLNLNISNENNENDINQGNIKNIKYISYKRYNKLIIHKSRNVLPLIDIINNSKIKTSYQAYRNNVIQTTTENKELNAPHHHRNNTVSPNTHEIQNDILQTSRTNTLKRESIKRKTINRGEEIKNVQITHIICSSKPTNFHMTEKLSSNIKTSHSIQSSRNNKEILRNPGKSTFSSSCQNNNIKPDKGQNLKGKTTVYQHCRGIGMTNDKRRNINSLYYNSEIKKLEPIKKGKDLGKVEYINNFRSNKNKNLNSTNNKGNDNNNKTTNDINNNKTNNDINYNKNKYINNNKTDNDINNYKINNDNNNKSNNDNNNKNVNVINNNKSNNDNNNNINNDINNNKTNNDNNIINNNNNNKINNKINDNDIIDNSNKYLFNYYHIILLSMLLIVIVGYFKL